VSLLITSKHETDICTIAVHLFRSFVVENVQLPSDVEAHAVVVAVGIRRRVSDKRHAHGRVGLYVVADAIRPGVRGQREKLVNALPGDELRLELLLATAVQAHGHDARRTVTVGRRVHTGRASVTSRPVNCGTHRIRRCRSRPGATRRERRRRKRAAHRSRAIFRSRTTDGTYIFIVQLSRVVSRLSHVDPGRPSTTTVGQSTTSSRTPGDFRDDTVRVLSSITSIGDGRRTIIVMLLLLSFITGENITSNVIDDKRYTKYFRNHHHYDKVMFLSWYIYIYTLLLTDEKLIVGRGGDDVVGSRYQLQLLDIRIIDIIDKMIKTAPNALFRPSIGQMIGKLK